MASPTTSFVPPLGPSPAETLSGRALSKGALLDAEALLADSAPPWAGEPASLTPSQWAKAWSWHASRADALYHPQARLGAKRAPDAFLESEDALDTLWAGALEEPAGSVDWAQIGAAATPLGVGRLLFNAAAERGRPDVIQALIASGVDPMAPLTTAGSIALTQAAAVERNWEIFDYLLAATPDPLKPNASGCTTLNMLCAIETFDPQTAALREERVRTVLPPGPIAGPSPLLDAAALFGMPDKGSFDRLFDLLIPRCDIFERDHKGRSALALACEASYLSCVARIAREMVAVDPRQASQAANDAVDLILADADARAGRAGALARVSAEKLGCLDALCALGLLCVDRQIALLAAANARGDGAAPAAAAAAAARERDALLAEMATAKKAAGDDLGAAPSSEDAALAPAARARGRL